MIPTSVVRLRDLFANVSHCPTRSHGTNHLSLASDFVWRRARNNRSYRLKKGSAYHYDLLIVGLLNGALSLYGLPMMHGVLPHSPLHARSLADIEERIEEGHLREV